MGTPTLLIYGKLDLNKPPWKYTNILRIVFQNLLKVWEQ